MESFSRERQALGIAELADLLQISRSTTHRYAITLVMLGYLEQDPKRKYRLSSRAAGPGSAVIGAIRKQTPARIALEELRNETGFTVSMGVLDGTHVIYLHRLLGHGTGQHTIDMDLGVGANVPAYCTALGKALLANTPNTQRRKLLAELDLVPHGPRSITTKSKLAAELERIAPGEAVLSNEELTGGLCSIAVLVPRPHSDYQLAIEVTVPSSLYSTRQLLEEIGPRLRYAAELISGE